MTRTTEEWLALDDDELIRELSKMQPGSWKHDWAITAKSERLCSKCHVGYCDARPCPVPDPIKIDLGTALERFRTYTRNELFEPMLDIARPHQPNGEFANIPVNEMQEIAERYCLYKATAREIWIICAVALYKQYRSAISCISFTGMFANSPLG